jgi:hypothetical protein
MIQNLKVTRSEEMEEMQLVIFDEQYEKKQNKTKQEWKMGNKENSRFDMIATRRKRPSKTIAPKLRERVQEDFQLFVIVTLLHVSSHCCSPSEGSSGIVEREAFQSVEMATIRGLLRW